MQCWENKRAQTIVKLFAALKANLENERVAEHALAVLDVDEADCDHAHSVARLFLAAEKTTQKEMEKHAKKKRNTPKKSGPVQKSDRRNTLTEKTRGFVAQFRHIFNAKKQVWIVTIYTISHFNEKTKHTNHRRK